MADRPIGTGFQNDFGGTIAVVLSGFHTASANSGRSLLFNWGPHSKFRQHLEGYVATELTVLEFVAESLKQRF
jgi:hypothetical protein